MITLASELPYEITYRGQKYKLCPAFDNVLRMLDATEGLDPIDQIDVGLHFLIDGDYPLDENLYAACIELITPQHKGLANNNGPSFDFKQDAPYIYASFRQAYHLDLFEQQGKMHWWTFMSLLTGLPSNTKFCEVVSIRTRPLPEPNKHNAKERMELIRLKQAYALTLSEEQKAQNLQNGFRKIADCLLGMAKRGDT